MKNQTNMTIMSKVIYNYDEVRGIMPCFNSYKTIVLGLSP